jgi:hypothetical protein
MKIPLKYNLFSIWLSHMTLNPDRNLFSLRADACGESDEIVSKEKVPATFSGSMPLLVQQPIRW